LTKKWGDANWAYFPIAYTILLTLTIGIIQLIEISSCYRIMFIVIFVVIEFLLCFFCPRFKNLFVNFLRNQKLKNVKMLNLKLQNQNLPKDSER